MHTYLVVLRLRPAVDLVLLVDAPADVATVLNVVRRRVDHRLEGLSAAAVPAVPAAAVSSGWLFSGVVRYQGRKLLLATFTLELHLPNYRGYQLQGDK